jgi:hypothetical protein
VLLSRIEQDVPTTRMLDMRAVPYGPVYRCFLRLLSLGGPSRRSSRTAPCSVLFSGYAIVGKVFRQEAGARLVQEGKSKVTRSRGKVVDLTR